MTNTNTNTYWCESVDKVIHEQREKCIAYKWLHEYEYKKLTQKNKYINMTIIIIVSIAATGTAVANNTK